MMKKIMMMGTVCFLAACTGVSGQGVSVGIGLGGLLGNHVGVGTSVQIPIGVQTNVVVPPSVSMTDNMIYFDAKGQNSDGAVKNGFYRKVLTKQSDGLYLVQDFYEMGGRKRTDPMQLQASQLHTFRASPDNGTLTIYSLNGSVIQQQTFQQGKLIK